MKNILSMFVLLLVFGFCPVIAAEHKDHESEKPHAEDVDHEEGFSANLGEGKAVEAFEDGKKIRLAQKAIERIGLMTQMVSLSEGRMWIPLKALVISRGETFVFVSLGERWFEKVAVKTGKKTGGRAEIKSGLKAGTQIVVEAAGTLRVTELDLLAGESVGHGH